MNSKYFILHAMNAEYMKDVELLIARIFEIKIKKGTFSI